MFVNCKRYVVSFTLSEADYKEPIHIKEMLVIKKTLTGFVRQSDSTNVRQCRLCRRLAWRRLSRHAPQSLIDRYLPFVARPEIHSQVGLDQYNPATCRCT